MAKVLGAKAKAKNVGLKAGHRGLETEVHQQGLGTKPRWGLTAKPPKAKHSWVSGFWRLRHQTPSGLCPWTLPTDFRPTPQIAVPSLRPNPGNATVVDLLIYRLCC